MIFASVLEKLAGYLLLSDRLEPICRDIFLGREPSRCKGDGFSYKQKCLKNLRYGYKEIR